MRPRLRSSTASPKASQSFWIKHRQRRNTERHTWRSQTALPGCNETFEETNETRTRSLTNERETETEQSPERFSSLTRPAIDRDVDPHTQTHSTHLKQSHRTVTTRARAPVFLVQAHLLFCAFQRGSSTQATVDR
jgi:hypothetical protein